MWKTILWLISKSGNNKWNLQNGFGIFRGGIGMSGVATLSNEKNYTVFQFENHVIRFIAPYSLERYIAVKEWEDVYKRQSMTTSYVMICLSCLYGTATHGAHGSFSK